MIVGVKIEKEEDAVDTQIITDTEDVSYEDCLTAAIVLVREAYDLATAEGASMDDLLDQPIRTMVELPSVGDA